MKTYGFPYYGSKNTIAEDIIAFLPRGRRLVDLFGGGFAISHCALFKGKYEKVLYNDFNSLTVQLLKDILNGRFNKETFKLEWISREDFYRLKETDGYIKFIWSFGNKGKDYVFGKKIEAIKKAMYQTIVLNQPECLEKILGFNIPHQYMSCSSDDEKFECVKAFIKTRDFENKYFYLYWSKLLTMLKRINRIKFKTLSNLDISNIDYKDYEYKSGDVVYCDIPYPVKLITRDTYNFGFDFNAFYNWADGKDYPVFFSSFNNLRDDRFKIVWSKYKVNRLDTIHRNRSDIECIYANRVGYDTCNDTMLF